MLCETASVSPNVFPGGVVGGVGRSESDAPFKAVSFFLFAAVGADVAIDALRRFLFRRGITRLLYTAVPETEVSCVDITRIWF